MKKLDIIMETASGGLRIPDQYRQNFDDIIKFCNEKRGGFVRLIVSPPFKHRTTGEKSQNRHINGHVQQIANETGEDFDNIKMYAKRKAIKRGYPVRTDIFGETVPLSETEISTEEAGYLIEALHEIASFLEINLKEGEDETIRS